MLSKIFILWPETDKDIMNVAGRSWLDQDLIVPLPYLSVQPMFFS